MRFLLVLPFFFILSTAEIIPPSNFYKTKDLVRTSVYYDLDNELYCNCPFVWQGKKGVVATRACGYEIRNNELRASRIEWEHVLPISIVGRQMKCWKNGERKNCRQISTRFNKAEADVHNLLPVIGEINADRANFPFGPVARSSSGYGSCDAKIDFKAWNRQYPVTEWEKERNQRNACIMGWGNDYVSKVDLSLCKQKPRHHPGVIF